MRRFSVRAATWCALIAGLVLQPSIGGKEAPDFSGSWVRDQGASDDPVEKVKDQNAQGGGSPRRRPFGISFPGGVWYPGRGTSRGGPGSGGAGGPWGGTPGTGTGGGGPTGGPNTGPYGGGPSTGGGRGGQGGGGSAGGGGSQGGNGGGGGGGRGGSLDVDGAVRLAGGVQAWKIEHRDPEIVLRDANRETRVLFTDGRVLGDGMGSKIVANWRGDTLEVETQGSLGTKTERWRVDPAVGQLTVVTKFEFERGGEFSFTTIFDRVEGGAPSDGAPAGSAGSVEARAADDDEPPSIIAETDGVPGEPRAGVDRAPAPLPDPADAEAELRSHAQTSRIRVLPPPRPGGALLTGKVMFDTLTIDPEVVAVEFYLDGHRSARRAWPPFQAKLDLDSPAREQMVRVVALGGDDRVLGEDEMVVNRVDPPFRVHIASMSRTASGGLEVRADVSIPRLAQVEHVAFYLGDRVLGEMAQPPFVARVEAADFDPEAFVRVVATLRDGRERENVALLDEKVFVENVDVRMVELQLVVTDRTGTAVGGLAVDDFEIVEGKKTLRPEQLYPAERVGLLLGLAIDSSGSMWPLWDQTRAAASYFLDHTLQARDRAFLVDFDSELRLIEPPTPDPQRLAWGLERLYPHGGTVLYDSILFSMLQYEGETGRRALIVITDGVDSESRSDPTRAIEYGKRLGVPVYVIALSGVGPGQSTGPGWQHSSPRTAAAAEEAMARNEIRLITDPTGGRLFHVVGAEQMARAFAEIQDELHRQYVLTYYTERPPGEGGPPEVKVRRAGLEVRSAVPLDSAR